jgi:hypothetical protein
MYPLKVPLRLTLFRVEEKIINNNNKNNKFAENLKYENKTSDTVT